MPYLLNGEAAVHVRTENGEELARIAVEAEVPHGPAELPEGQLVAAVRIQDAETTPSLFPRLVLGRINADFHVQIRILQHFSSSTRLSHFMDISCEQY